MNESEKLALRATSCSDQWESTKDEMLRSCPNPVLVRAFNAASDVEELLYKLSEHNTVEHMSATIIRCEYHREILRRVAEGTLTLDFVTGGGK